MIKYVVRKASDKVVISVEGHAGFDEAGKDIVCAAASVLYINTVNAIETLTDASIRTSSKQNLQEAHITSLDDKATLLIEAMCLGLQGIQEQYSDKYISFIVEEETSC